MTYAEYEKSEWLYVPGDPPVERQAVLIPGYNCGVRGSACKHEQKGDHGVHNDELLLYLRTLPEPQGRRLDVGYEAAVQLTLFTLRRDGAIEKNGILSERAGYAASVVGHIGYVHEESDVQHGSPPEPCKVLRVGACYPTEPLGLYARHIWTAADDAALEPILLEPDVRTRVLSLTSGVWERMREHLRETTKALREKHEALPKQCSACGGTGLVPRPS